MFSHVSQGLFLLFHESGMGGFQVKNILQISDSKADVLVHGRLVLGFFWNSELSVFWCCKMFVVLLYSVILNSDMDVWIEYRLAYQLKRKICLLVVVYYCLFAFWL